MVGDQGHSEAEAPPPEWARRMAEMLAKQAADSVAQAAKIEALQVELLHQNGRTPPIGLHAPSPTTPGHFSPALTPQEEREYTKSPVWRHEELPKLPEYSGDKTGFRPWLAQVKAKLRVDLWDKPEDTRVWYIHSRLRGKASTQVQPWVTAAEKMQDLTVDGLLEQLERAYDDPEAMERATRKLSNLTQGSKSFSTFLAEFDRTLLDAGGLGWQDAVKRSYLLNGITLELRQALVATPIPKSYQECCSLLHQVSNNLDTIKGIKKTNIDRTATMTTTTPHASGKEDAMEWEASPPVITSTVASQKVRAKWVTQEVLNGRRDEGSCYRCGKAGHIVRNCTYLPAVRPIV
jgi:hypothetical protein